jgi:hypothetical protein
MQRLPDWRDFDRDNWVGSHIQLAVDLGEPDDERLRAAFAAAWSNPHLNGPLESLIEGVQPRLPEPPFDPDLGLSTDGTISLPPDAVAVGCRVLSVQDGLSNWLVVAIPTGMLELAFRVDYELSHQRNPWLAGVERRLAEIGDTIYRRVPFDLGIIGAEVSGQYYADQNIAQKDPWRKSVSRQVVDDWGGLLLSPTLWAQLAPESEPEVLASGLRWVKPKWP